MSSILAAHYLEKHDYLNYPAQIINFGGKYLYQLKSDKGDIVVSRKRNNSFQTDFFDISKNRVKVCNVSAIVGQNGIGKSSILNSIRQHFIDKPYALPDCKSVMLYEIGDELTYSSNREDINVGLDDGNIVTPLKRVRKESVQTIYYSPHFDLKFIQNFDEVDYHDISLERYFDLDLEDLSSRGTNENGMDYPIKQELLFKNSQRQIRFLNSPLVTEEKIFEGLITFPDHGNARFVTRNSNFDEKPRNVPVAFLHPLSELGKQIGLDLDRWTETRHIDKNKRVTNQVEIERYLLQRHLVRNLLSVIVRQMDVSNDYRSSGEFDQKYFDSHRGKDSLQGLLALLRSFRIPTVRGIRQPFDVDLIEILFRKLYTITDSIISAELLTSYTFQTSPGEAIELLELQNKVIFNLSNYYNLQHAKKPADYRQLNYLVPSFLYYTPADRHLSSGENAFLNFFSKLYNFLTEKLNPVITPKPEVRSYLLLLDEADLGFHPLWKKKYLYILTRTLGYFFNQFSGLETLQLIFTTHDPLSLSDLPNNNVVYLRSEDGVVKVLDHKERKPTFAANITDLLADSFFVEDGLIGDFAQHKIENVISWLNGDSKEEAGKYRQTIEMIDEPIVRRKLAEMYDVKMSDNLEVSLIDKQLMELNERKLKLLNDRNTGK